MLDSNIKEVMIRIYHNTRCAKSRAALKYLDEKGVNFEIIEYLKEPPSEKELTSILKKLGMKPMDLIRKNEKIFKDNYKGKDFTDREWINIMSDNPKLIERPVVVKGSKAVVAWPAEKIEELFD